MHKVSINVRYLDEAKTMRLPGGDLPLQKSAYVKVFKVRDEAFRCRFPLLHECIGDAEVHRVVDDLVVLGVGDAPVQFFILPAGAAAVCTGP